MLSMYIPSKGICYAADTLIDSLGGKLPRGVSLVVGRIEALSLRVAFISPLAPPSWSTRTRTVVIGGLSLPADERSMAPSDSFFTAVATFDEDVISQKRAERTREEDLHSDTIRRQRTGWQRRACQRRKSERTGRVFPSIRLKASREQGDICVCRTSPD